MQHGVQLRNQAEAERRRGDIEAARRLYETAVAAMREEGADVHRLAHTIRHLGEVCEELGDLPAAGRHCREALDLCESHPGANALDVANAVRALAVVLESAGEYSEARRLWIDARARYAELSIEEGVAGTSRRLERLEALGIE